MNLKLYSAATMREVMAQIREEMGPDAVILSQNRTATGVEVTVAVERPVSQPEAEKPSQNHQAWSSGSHILGQKTPTDEIQRMQQDLAQIKKMLEGQLSTLAYGDYQEKHPAQVATLKRLMQLGLGWRQAQALVKDYGQSQDEAYNWAQVQGAIMQAIKPDEESILDKGGVVSLVGPTGVGKTTTIAKLAARYVMRYGQQSVVLMTTDNYKIGAKEQLKTFADLIRVPLYAVENARELYHKIAEVGQNKLVLIDTAGMSHKDIRLNQQLTQQLGDVRVIRNYLLVSASTQYQVLQDIFNSFSHLQLHGLILTKLDEALLLGHALNLLLVGQIPLSYVTTGQRVPEDIQVMSPRDFLDHAISMGQQQANVNEMEMALHLGLGQEFGYAQ